VPEVLTVATESGSVFSQKLKIVLQLHGLFRPQPEPVIEELKFVFAFTWALTAAAGGWMLEIELQLRGLFRPQPEPVIEK
jgi:hypothetical protein